MKFYIFTSNKKEIKSSRRKAFFKSDNFEECYDKFYNLCEENRFDNAYLVADFECYRKKWVSSVDENSEENIPFFIVCEYHTCIECPNTKNYSRQDNTCVFRKGFVHEFTDNLAAIREFLYCFENHIVASFEIRYKLDNRIYKRNIADTVSIIRTATYSGYKLKRIKLDISSNWETVPTVEERKLQMYKLEGTKSNKKLEVASS